MATENVTFNPIDRGGEVESKHNWGQPLKIVMAIMDKRCPECNHSRSDDPRLDIGKENGKYFGGLCFNCGWRFSLGIDDEVPPCVS